MIGKWFIVWKKSVFNSDELILSALEISHSIGRLLFLQQINWFAPLNKFIREICVHYQTILKHLNEEEEYTACCCSNVLVLSDGKQSAVLHMSSYGVSRLSFTAKRQKHPCSHLFLHCDRNYTHFDRSSVWFSQISKLYKNKWTINLFYLHEASLAYKSN